MFKLALLPRNEGNKSNNPNEAELRSAADCCWRQIAFDAPPPLLRQVVASMVASLVAGQGHGRTARGFTVAALVRDGNKVVHSFDTRCKASYLRPTRDADSRTHASRADCSSRGARARSATCCGP